jgi:hypothetical protein
MRKNRDITRRHIPAYNHASEKSVESVYCNFSESCWWVTITRGHQSNEVLFKAKRAQTKKGTPYSQQAGGSQSRNRIFDGPRITLK